MLWVGFAQAVITPEESVWLAGFSPLRLSQAVASDLKIRLVVMEDVDISVWIQVDTIAIDQYLFDLIVAVFAKYDIGKHQLIVSATHTHSAPAGLVDTSQGYLKGLDPIFGQLNPLMVETILDQVEYLWLEALSNKQQVIRLRLSDGNIIGLASERHDPLERCDQRLLTWELTLSDEQQLLFYHYAIHPTILNQQSQVISADLPGAVEALLPQYAMVFYLNGCAGDISTRFTRSSNDQHQLDQFADQLSEQLTGIMNTAIDIEVSGPRCRSMTCKLPLVKVLSVEEANVLLSKALEALKNATINSMSDQRLMESKVEGAKTQLLLAQSLQSANPLTITCNIIDFGGYQLVTFPGELYSTLGLQLEPKARVIGYTNGYYLYLPDSSAYTRCDYEAASSIFAPGAGELFIEELMKHLGGNHDAGNS